MFKSTVFVVALALLAGSTLAQRKCTVTSYGKGCGPVMTASVTPNGNTVKVRLTVSKTAPNAVVIMAIGDNPLDLPAIGLADGCRWLVNPVFIQFHRANDAGRFSHARAISATFLGTYYAQFVELGDPAKTTNGIKLECK